MQRSSGLYGMLIVRSPKERLIYDGEFNLLLSDWWHQSIHAQELALSSRPMRWIGEPQSLLINGRGQFNCSQAAYFNKGGEKDVCTFKENDQCAPQTLRVEPNRVYRLRIASTTALASLNLAVQVSFFLFNSHVYFKSSHVWFDCARDRDTSWWLLKLTATTSHRSPSTTLTFIPAKLILFSLKPTHFHQRSTGSPSAFVAENPKLLKHSP